jgi:hypothetical protein
VKSPQPGGGAKPPDSKIEDWWAQFETSIWDQVRIWREIERRSLCLYLKHNIHAFYIIFPFGAVRGIFFFFFHYYYYSYDIRTLTLQKKGRS